MQAYMKSSMPFRGVAKPARVALLRELSVQRCDDVELAAAASELWDQAAYREERYVATALARRLPPDVARLAVHRHWIVTGAWWDHVDEIAQHLVGRSCGPSPKRWFHWYATGRNIRIGGCAERRSSASSAPRSAPTLDCWRRPSNRARATETSSCARPSGGPCASMHVPTRSGSSHLSTATQSSRTCLGREALRHVGHTLDPPGSSRRR